MRTLCIKPSEPFSLSLKADKAQQTFHRNNKNKPGESAKTKKIKIKALVIMLFFALEFWLALAAAGDTTNSLALAAVHDTTNLGIGIDMGTAYSRVGVYRDQHVEIIANDQGNRFTPSWVAFTDTDRLIGEATKNQAALSPERTIFDVKRLVGRRFDDPKV